MKRISEEVSEAISQVFITMQVKKLDDTARRLIEEHRFNLELGIGYYSLDLYPPEYFRELSRWLRKLKLRLTVHAPFNELFLGAPDSKIRKASVDRLNRAFAVIRYFRPESVVLHLNYEEKRFRFVYDDWFSFIIPNLKRYAEKCRMMGSFLSIENVYEETPEAMNHVFRSLRGYAAGHCVDVGHIHAFSQTDLRHWLKVLGRYVRQFHLHDNGGGRDAHGPIGSGSIDFDYLRDFIASMRRKPLITLEPHREEHIWETLEGYVRFRLNEAMRKRR